jgi:hypothetical protein
MKRVISFSIYKAPDEWEKSMETNYDKYLVGIEENAKLASIYYPDWIIYLYHNENFDISKIQHIKELYNIETKIMTNPLLNAMQWRFLPNDDEEVELFICRDLDSRITEREQVSVTEWIESGKILHIMRDHPHHTGYPIVGCCWGMRCQKDFNMSESCIQYNTEYNYVSEKDWYDKWWDMDFLGDIVYPKYLSSSFINSETGHASESWSKPFTKNRDDRKFVGEIYTDKYTRGYQYTLL